MSKNILNSIIQYFINIGLPKKDLFLLYFFLFTLICTVFIFVYTNSLQLIIDKCLEKRRIIKKFGIIVKK